MKALPLMYYPAHILRVPADECAEITEETNRLVSDMIVTMRKNDGIGLAAPQVNVSKQIIVIQDVRKEDTSYAFINPSVTEYGEDLESAEEGCLSLPNLFVPVKRAQTVEVSCTTLEGKDVILKAEGLAARIFQHEIDHINGKLIIDRTDPIHRLRVRSKLKAFEKQAAS